MKRLAVPALLIVAALGWVLAAQARPPAAPLEWRQVGGASEYVELVLRSQAAMSRRQVLEPARQLH